MGRVWKNYKKFILETLDVPSPTSTPRKNTEKQEEQIQLNTPPPSTIDFGETCLATTEVFIKTHVSSIPGDSE